MKSNHKIAVYFSGHIRNLKDNIRNYRRVFQHPNIKFDYYFTLWRTNHNTDNDSWNHNNITNKKLIDISNITEKDVYDICPDAKNVVILEEFQLSHEYTGYKPSTVFQLYSLYKGFQELPSTYDLYVRMRPDLYFFNGIDWDYILNNSTNYNLFIPETVHFNLQNYPKCHIFNDYFWVSSYEQGKHISELFKNIHNMEKGYIAEVYYALHVSKNNPNILHCHFDVTLERRTRGFDTNLYETKLYTERRRVDGDYI